MHTERFTDKWRGKSWATLGDSITAADGYQPLVRKELGFGEVFNFGKSGCPMAAGGEHDEGSTYRVGMSLNARFDVVTIFAGTNDYRLGKPLGSIGAAGAAHNPLTFAGAYQAVIEYVLTVNPLCRLNLWTPLQRDKDGYDLDHRNDAGCRLGDYAAAVRDIGAAYSLPVLDLFTVSGFNKLTLDALTRDRLHPNEAGYRRIAGLAAAFLAAL